jgi:hypothetical protein
VRSISIVEDIMRQFDTLTDGEIADLGDAIARCLVAELQRMVGSEECRRQQPLVRTRRTVRLSTGGVPKCP